MSASSTSAIPYIGSKISLVTNSELRYEGVLLSINTVNSTVTLQNVRMSGTENRKAPSYVMPSSEVFDYIVFNGKDIKDLTVSEPGFSIKEDPAVVAVNVAPTHAGFINDSRLMGNQMQDHHSGLLSMHSSHRMPGGVPMGRIDSYAYGNGPHRGPFSPLSRGMGRDGMSYNNRGMDYGMNYNNRPEADYNRPDGGYNRPDGGYNRPDGGYNRPDGGYNRPDGGYNRPDGGYNRPEGGYGGRGAGYRGRGGGAAGMGRVVGELTAQPNSNLKTQVAAAFDFEQSNSKFEKDKIEKENMKAPGSSNEPYNKTASFFDNISCETLNRQHGRDSKVDREKQRVLDTETFGPTAALSRGPRYYRRGPRRMGGGGLRGRGGGGHPGMYGGGGMYGQLGGNYYGPAAAFGGPMGTGGYDNMAPHIHAQ